MDLTEKKCKPCEGGSDPLTLDEENTYLPMVEGWEIDRSEAHTIRRTFKFKNFVKALEFANRVGEIAEQEGHHPELHIGWGHTKVELFTHAVNGLSQNDFIVAAKVNRIAG